jgi:hypothetical protein
MSGRGQKENRVLYVVISNSHRSLLTRTYILIGSIWQKENGVFRIYTGSIANVNIIHYQALISPFIVQGTLL